MKLGTSNSPRASSSSVRPAENEVEPEALSKAQRKQLQAIGAFASAARDAFQPDDQDLANLAAGFQLAGSFEDKNCPEFVDCVCDLLGAYIELVHEAPRYLGSFLDGRNSNPPIPAIAKLPFMTQTPLVGELIDWLLQGDEVALHMAASLVGELAPSDERANLTDVVLNAVAASSPSPSVFSHCVRVSLEGLEGPEHAPLAVRLAHLCLERMELAVAGQEHGMLDLACLLSNFVNDDVRVQTDQVFAGIGRLLLKMLPDPDGGRMFTAHAYNEPRTWLVLFQQPQLPAALKQHLAGRAINTSLSRPVASLPPGTQVLLNTACRSLAEDFKIAWIKNVLSGPAHHLEFEELVQSVNSVESVEDRHRLLGMVREKLVTHCVSQQGDARVPDLVRLALTMGAGDEHRLGSALTKFAQWNTATLNRDRKDQIAVLSFHLDPDGTFDPDGPVSQAQFLYPDWLVERRTVLQEAHPAIDARPAFAEQLPDSLARLTNAYVGRHVRVEDWDALRVALMDSRETEAPQAD